jgi:hypothetical protein
MLLSTFSESIRDSMNKLKSCDTIISINRVEPVCIFCNKEGVTRTCECNDCKHYFTACVDCRDRDNLCMSCHRDEKINSIL